MNNRTAITAVVAVLLCVLLALYFVGQSTACKQLIEKKICALFLRDLHSIVQARLTQVNLLRGQLVFEDVSVIPYQDTSQETWQWKSKKVIASFSWLDVVAGKKSRFYIDTIGFDALSFVSDDGTFAIMKHIKEIFLSSVNMSIPLTFKGLKIQDGAIHLHNNHGVQVHLGVNSTTERIDAAIKTTLSFTDGMVVLQDRIYAHRIEGTMGLHVYGGKQVVLEPNIRCVVPLVHTQSPVLIFGSFNGTEGNFLVKTMDGACSIDQIDIAKQEQGLKIHVKGTGELAIIQRIMTAAGYQLPEITGKGACEIFAQKAGDITANVKIAIDQATINKFPIEHLEFSGTYAHQNMNGAAELLVPWGKFQITGNWDHAHKKINGIITNSSALTQGAVEWYARANQLKMKTAIDYQDHQVQAESEITGCIVHKKNDTPVQLALKSQVKNKKVVVAGSVNDYELKGLLYSAPRLHLLRATLSRQGQQIAVVKKKPGSSHTYALDTAYQFFQSLMPEKIKANLIGTGTVHLQLTPSDDHLQGTITCSDAHVKIVPLANGLQHMTGAFTVQYKDHTLELRDIDIGLQKGRIKVPHLLMRCASEKDVTACSVQADVVVEQLFMGIKDKLQALCTGAVRYTLQDQHGTLSGKLTLEHGFFKDMHDDPRQLPLATTESNYQNQDVDLELTIKPPFMLYSSSLDAQTCGTLRMSKQLGNPFMVGTINVEGGVVKFPYKNLLIERGQLFFEGAMRKPLIEVVAKNRVKQFSITLQITGPTDNPSLTFDSSPSLTEDQIIALLLVGSEHDSLSGAIPAFLVNNLTSFLTSYLKNSSKLPPLVQKALKSLDHVRVVSSQNQTGSGGLSGGLEIDVSDRLRALVQKDLMSDDQARIELEYLLTDEINLRGIKDEKGNLAGELEMKWKF